MRDDLHAELLEALDGRLPPEVVDTWIRPLRVLDAADSRVELGVPNKFFRQYLEQNYLDALRAAAVALAGPRAHLVLTIDRSIALAPAPTTATAPPATPPDLDARYSFDTFVVGSSNQFAQAACRAVAEAPSVAYNPLFIYGGVGLGKTHLLQAIGHRLAQSQRDLRIQYLSTEKFTNDLIAAIRHDRTPDFRQRYRTMDLLLIDDVQFLSGKERTQDEFFHTFNDLHPNRQIVLSSDRSPKEIPDIEERLRSRFEWGLIADIQPPDFETRVAILKKKAELDRVLLPDDVAYFIANRVKSNIRELEGSLVRIRAFCNLTGRPLTLDLAQEVLANIWGAEERLVTIDDILRRVGEVFNVKTQELRAKTRTKAVAFPRQVAMYLARQLTSDSYADIGRGFGGKDHTTVLHAVNKIEALLQQDPKFRRTLDHIINTIRLA
jgi:chromosomal replication initiator protein